MQIAVWLWLSLEICQGSRPVPFQYFPLCDGEMRLSSIDLFGRLREWRKLFGCRIRIPQQQQRFLQRIRAASRGREELQGTCRRNRYVLEPVMRLRISNKQRFEIQSVQALRGKQEDASIPGH